MKNLALFGVLLLMLAPLHSRGQDTGFRSRDPAVASAAVGDLVTQQDVLRLLEVVESNVAVQHRSKALAGLAAGNVGPHVDRLLHALVRENEFPALGGTEQQQEKDGFRLALMQKIAPALQLQVPAQGSEQAAAAFIIEAKGRLPNGTPPVPSAPASAPLSGSSPVGDAPKAASLPATPQQPSQIGAVWIAVGIAAIGLLWLVLKNRRSGS